ncbi:MAG: helix-turn-helix domain-containing protein [Pyrinomonadaceae bacterium]
MENIYEKLLDINEASALLGVKPGTLYSWVSKKKVPFRKVGVCVRFHWGDLMEWTNQTAKTSARRAPLRVVK